MTNMLNGQRKGHVMEDQLSHLGAAASWRNYFGRRDSSNTKPAVRDYLPQISSTHNKSDFREKDKRRVCPKEPDGRASSSSEQQISSTPLPRPVVNSLETDSEEDPDYNQEEFIRLRSSLHRKIVEAEREDLKKNDRRKGKRATNPCRKISQLFQRIFTSNSNRFPTSTTTTTASQESHLPSANLSNLKSPSSINQKLGEVHVLSCDSTDDDDYLI